MKIVYKYCSLCGSSLHKKGIHLACMECSFVNYRNARPTVTVFILHNNKLLLTRRKNKPFYGWWDIPGGFIDHGEHPETAIVRELKEETGLHLRVQKLFGIYPGTYPSSFDPFYVLSIFYIARPTRGITATVKDTEELLDARWFTKKNLPKKIAFDSNQRAMKDFLKIWK